MKKLFLILAFIAPVATFAQDTLQHVVLSPDKYKERISAGVQLVDVRTPEEFAEGHIEDARNIDVLRRIFWCSLTGTTRKNRCTSTVEVVIAARKLQSFFKRRDFP